MKLETFIRLCDYLNITSSENQSDLLGWTIVNTKKAFFKDYFRDTVIKRYSLVQKIIEALDIDDVEISVEAIFDPNDLDFVYSLILVIDDDDEYCQGIIFSPTIVYCGRFFCPNRLSAICLGGVSLDF